MRSRSRARGDLSVIIWLFALPLFSGAQVNNGFEVTSLFRATANSTCGGDPPTIFAYNDVLFNCSIGEHDASLVLDKDNSTWWQSMNEEGVVAITFSLDRHEERVSLVVSGVKLLIRSPIPRSYHLELRERDTSTFYLQMVYVPDASFCVEQSIPCSIFVVNQNEIELIFPAMIAEQPVAEFRLTMTGDSLASPETDYQAIEEIGIFAHVATGYFTRYLNAIRVEGEDGIIQSTSSPLPRNSDPLQYPGYSGRGYAILNISADENLNGLWTIPSLPSPTEYQFVLLYSNHDLRSRRLRVTVIQNGASFNARVELRANCLACNASFLSPAQLNQAHNFSLTESMVVINIPLSSLDVSLDSIVVLPRTFYDPSSINDPIRFLSSCNIVTGPINDSFCLQNSLQLSVIFYTSTFGCSCISEDSGCQPYGGQCECLEPSLPQFSRPIGRQCNLCPLYSYFTINGCNECSCPDQFDDCDVETGQCANCPNLAFGPRCEDCVINSYQSDNGTCLPCECDPVGSISCNQSTGQCTCKEGIGGLSCDQCETGFFDFSSEGCMACNCGLGSANLSCSSSGQCYCMDGVSGLKCSDCLDGFYSLSSLGCLPCLCSNRTRECVLASNSTSGSPEENCTCPFPFTSMSCESCLSGYYLSDATGSCQQCECNGRADKCADGSGQCIDCMGNSTEQNCQLCIQGTYDADVTTGLNCQPCPCTLTTSTNISCISDLMGQPSCYCLPGHNSPLCDSCTSGYFGSPPATRCTDCSCNGNIDNTAPGSCDPVSGICLICINNSTGHECEVCESGYFGDATLQNCQLCDCKEEGSSSALCDRHDGQCPCLQGVGGLRCDVCQAGYWNFSAGLGCQPCDCNEASNSSLCDQRTGQCPCKYGIQGLDCSSCIDGFYNFSSDGCSDCSCGLGAFAQNCSSEGICNCLPGVTGVLCDQCLPFFSLLSSSGCEPCGGCENMLLFQLNSSESVIASIDMSSNLFQILMSIDLPNNLLLNSSLTTLNLRRLNLMDNLDVIKRLLSDLNETGLESVFLHSAIAEEQIAEADNRATSMVQYALAVQDHVISVYQMMQEIFIDTGNVNNFIISIENALAAQVQYSSQIAFNVSATTAEHSSMSDLADTLALAQRIKSRLGQYQEGLAHLSLLVLGQINQTAAVARKYNSLNISRELFHLRSINESLSYLGDRCDDINAMVTQLSTDVPSLANMTSKATNILSRSDNTIAQAESLLFMSQRDIEDLVSTIGFISDKLFSGSGSGDALVSGSGEMQDETMSVSGSLSLLRAATLNLQKNFVQSQLEVFNASDTTSVIQSSRLLNRTLAPVILQGTLSAQAIRDYSTTIDILLRIVSLSNQTELILLNVLQQAMPLLDSNLSLQVLNIHNFSRQLLESARNQSSALFDLVNTFMSSTTTQAADVASISIDLSSMVTRLILSVSNLNRATSITTSENSLNLMQIESLVTSVQNVASQLSLSLPSFLTNVSMGLSRLSETQMLYNDTDGVINATKISTNNIHQAIEDRSALLSNISRVRYAYQIQLDSTNSSLSNLRLTLNKALSAAASIDIALQFYGNSSLSYLLDRRPTTPLESVSLVFRPDDVSFGSLLSSRDEPAILQLNNGSVMMEYGNGSVSVGDGTLVNNQWYQVYATRDENEAVLSLTSLPENGSFTSRAPILNSTPYMLLDDIVVLGGNGGGGTTSRTGYIGCMDRVIINHGQLPLLLPIERDIDVITCGPRISHDHPRDFQNGAWLFGASSYINLFSLIPFTEVDLQFYFRTFAETGILLFLPSDDFVQYAIIHLVDGRVALDFSLSAFDTTHLEATLLYNTGLWYSINLSINELNVTLTINGNETLFGYTSNMANLRFMPSGNISLGGISQEVFTLIDGIVPVNVSSVAGCIRDLQVNNYTVDLESSSVNNRIYFGGCPEMVASGVRFFGNGRAEFHASNQVLRSISIAFRTTQLASVLIYMEGLSISIFHTKIRVDLFNEVTLTSVQSDLNDNVMHTLSFVVVAESGNNYRLSLSVDGEGTVVSASYPTSLVLSEILYVGGVPSASRATVSESFRGCITSLIVNERELDFKDAETLLHISLYGCLPTRDLFPPPTLPPPPPPPIPPPPSSPLNVSIGLSGRNGTFTSLEVAEEQIINRFLILLEFRTVSSEGLLLYMQGPDSFGLRLVSGELLFSYDLGSGQANIKSNQSYNDGNLHTVEISRSGRTGQLVVDGGREIVSGTSPGSFSLLNIKSGQLFVGGIPAIMAPLRLYFPEQEIPAPVLACLYNLAINGVYEDLTNPLASNGVEQCLETYNNVVTLNQDSYMRMIDEFDVGVQFEFFINFRTRNCSGVLLYVASAIYTDHILVELRGGDVVLVFDNGPMSEELRYVNASRLCNGDWHSLRVVKNGLTASISVDEGIYQTITSSCSVCVNFLATNTNDPLYIGGIPETVRSRYTVESGSFQGCLSDLYISRDGSNLEALIFSQALDQKNVEFDACRY